MGVGVLVASALPWRARDVAVVVVSVTFLNSLLEPRLRAFDVFVGEDVRRPLRDAAPRGAHALDIVDYHVVPYVARRRCRLGRHMHNVVVVARRHARDAVGAFGGRDVHAVGEGRHARVGLHAGATGVGGGLVEKHFRLQKK